MVILAWRRIVTQASREAILRARPIHCMRRRVKGDITAEHAQVQYEIAIEPENKPQYLV